MHKAQEHKYQVASDNDKRDRRVGEREMGRVGNCKNKGRRIKDKVKSKIGIPKKMQLTG